MSPLKTKDTKTFTLRLMTLPLAAHGREFSKLSKHAAQLKRLSGSVMNVLNLDDAQDTRQAKAQRKESMRVPIVTHLTNHVPVIKPACSLFLEGAPGVGKTTTSKTPDPFSWFRKTSCTEGGADSTSRSFMYQKGFEEGLAGLGLDDKSDCESEDESNFRRPSSHSALKQKNGGKGKPSGLFEHLAAHGREFSKLSKHAAQLKRLSGSVMNVLNLDDAQDTRQAKAQRKESTRVPIVTHLTNHVPVIKPACSLFLEGAPGVGKTTMLNHLKAVFGDLTIVVPEPMRYWTHVYENAIKAMHKNVTRARHGREDTSAEVLACQMKFTTPFRVLASRKRSLLVTESGARSVAPLDCWILHDRHLLSASVVFPLMLLRSQLLSYSDFIQVLATFTADPGDTIVWMKLNVEENMRRLKKREVKRGGEHAPPEEAREET